MAAHRTRNSLSERGTPALGLPAERLKAIETGERTGSRPQPPKAGARSASLEPGRAPGYFASITVALPQAGEGEIKSDEANPSQPPLFSPHLRSLIEASMADPTDNRWLPVLAEEWGVPALRDLHLTCKSQAPGPFSGTSPAPEVAVPSGSP
jgi:hypothetical protein